jgi:GT2 family glycosyltransferase
MTANNSEFPLVSVISVNYNQAVVTSEFLASFGKVTYPNLEIILVDNGSQTRELETVANGHPGVTCIRSEINLGFAGGNNLGIRQAHGKYILFINNDTEVEPGFLQPLVAKLEESAQIGMISPKIRFFYAPDTIQYAGSTPLNRFTMRNRMYGWNQADRGQFDTPCITQFAHGAAMMVPSRVIESVGMMADLFFLYYEEIDWCTRIKNAGYTIWYEPKSLILHKESVTTGKMSPLKIYYITRNRILYARRNVHGLNFMISMLYLIIIAAPKNILHHLVKGNFHLIKPYIKAYLWHLEHFSLPQTEK